MYGDPPVTELGREEEEFYERTGVGTPADQSGSFVGNKIRLLFVARPM